MSFEDLLMQGATQIGLISVVSIILSLVALALTLRGDRVDRINANNWETYRAYNSEKVRTGRMLALRILNDPAFHGLASRDAYNRYFELPPYGAGDSDRSNERQALHDLAAFYHQIGVLLDQHLLDRNFTLLLVGPGLADRWPVLQPFATFYEQQEQGIFPYGGVYLLFRAYTRWQETAYPHIRRRFLAAREASHAANRLLKTEDSSEAHTG